MMETTFDPLRRRDVPLTPEERVRQWFISVLRDSVKVPMHMMMSEAGFKWGEKRYRADILVFDRQGKPLMVVECKRPEVEIDESVALQAMRYNAVLDVRWIFLTNGRKTLLFKRKEDRFIPSDVIPDYESASLSPSSGA